MRKAAGIFLIAVVMLSGVLVFRANSVFNDQQIEPARGISTVDIDLNRATQRFSMALKIPTISYDDRSHFDAGAFTDFRDFLKSAYPLVHRHARRTIVNDHSLVYELPGSDSALKPVLFMSHMDVVPIEEITRDEWTHPPFSGTVESGIIWGRGSVDDKSGVIALMEAMEQLLKDNIRPQRSIYLAFGHDEEVGGSEGAAKIAEHFAAQGISFDFVLDEGGAVTEGMVGGIDRPVAVVGVSEKGYVNLVLTVDAPGGHSSQPPDQTAVGILSRAIVRVEDNPFPASLEHIYRTFEVIGTEMPFGKRLVMGNLWLFSHLVRKTMLADKDNAAGIRTTTAATMVTGSPKSNILPTRATAVINSRILPGETFEAVKQRVVDLIDDERVSVSHESGVDPSPVSPIDSRGYGMIAGTIRGIDDHVLVAPYMVRGGTDARYFYGLSPNVYRFLMVRIDPDTIKYLHGIDEHISVENFSQAITFYYHMIRQSAAE
jgi:carboxypeptidase PM20D1